MDMNQFRKGKYITLETLGDEVRSCIIAGVEDGKDTKYGKPFLVLDNGDRFSLNTTNLETMIKHYGEDGTRWRGIEIKLLKGELPFNKGTTDAVVLTAVSPPSKGKAKSKGKGVDDAIPF